MQNLYDLLGVRPDDDAESLKKAFRRAAKASHPDHHGGDPQAAARFRRISAAYEILRDARQRAAYDRLLELERRPLRHKVKRSLFDVKRYVVKRHIVRDVMAGILIVAVLATGYGLYARILQPSVHGTAGVTSRVSERAASDLHRAEGIGAAGTDRPGRAAAPRTPVVTPTAPVAAVSAADGQTEVPGGEAVSSPAGSATVIAIRDGEPAVPTGPGKTGGEPDGKTPEPARATAGGVKLPDVRPTETKMPARPSAATKPHAPGRSTPIEQAALENRNSGAPETGNTPAPDTVPSRVFGVGF
jgi:DnaJ domain